MTTMAPAAKTTSKRSSKKTSTKTPAPAPEPIQVKTETVTEATEEAQDAEPEPTFEDVVVGYNEIVKAMKDLNVVLKRVVSAQAKRIKELEKEATKGGKKRRVANPDAKKNNGFNKPSLVSPEMSTFLGIPAEQMVSRSEVSKAVHSYIKEHNLQKEENRRHINPDAKLQALLAVKGDQEVTYFNLQRFLAPHYIKESK